MAISYDNTQIGQVEVTTGPTVDAATIAAPVVDVASSLASGLASVGQGILNAFSGIANIGVKKLPLANDLDKYSSYSCVFTLFALDKASFNVPETSYIKGLGQLPIVLRSGNGYPNNRIKTDLGKFDFYIDDVVVHSNYGFNPKTGNSHAYAIDFTVVEPYSMGMFPLSLNQAATKALKKDKADKDQVTNFMIWPFCLSLQFMGEDQSGSYSAVPKTTKYFTIHFTDIQMDVSEGGARYTCKANATSESALLHSNVKLTSEMSFAGRTVQEVLQTGPQSLTAIINDHLKKQADGKYTPDEIVIMFPKDQSSAKSSGSGNQGASEQTASPTVSTQASVRAVDNSIAAASAKSVFDVVGVARESKSQSLYQTTPLNSIGISKLGYGNTREGYPVSPGVGIYDEKTHNWDQSQIAKDPTLSSYAINSDSTITNAINQVLLSSDYARDALKADKIKEGGMRTMWQIIPTYYMLKSDNNAKFVGRPPRLIVFNVVPYDVLSTTLGVPGSNISTTHYKQLLASAPKVYDYIYSGKNTQVKKLNIHFDALFRSLLPNDMSKRSKDAVTQKQNSSLVDPNAVDVDFRGGATSNNPTAGLEYIMSFAGTNAPTDGKGAGGTETEEHRMARWFYNAMVKGADMMELEMEIVGDPFWLSSSGWGNYRSAATTYWNVNSDLSVNHHNGEVDCIVRLRTPTDINSVTGLYNMNGSKALTQWSGLYKVFHVESHFKNGEFYQIIKANKRQITPADGQEIVYSTVTKPAPAQPLAKVAGGDGTWSA